MNQATARSAVRHWSGRKYPRRKLPIPVRRSSPYAPRRYKIWACAPHARFIDVFCDEGAFTVEESRRVLVAGAAAGLGLRLHAAQLAPSPEAIAMGVALGAASIDHCTYLTDADIELLAQSSTVATLLPGVEFSTRQPYPDARRLADAGVTSISLP